MDLGSFGVDQELEQADRLQHQALQLLQHAGSSHAWSPRSDEPFPELNPGDQKPHWPEDVATSWETCSEHFQDDQAPLTARDQEVPSGPSTRQQKLYTRSFQNYAQIGSQMREDLTPPAPSQAKFMQAAGAYLTNEQPQLQQSRPSDVSFPPTVDLRPSVMAARPWSMRAGQVDGQVLGAAPNPLRASMPVHASGPTPFTTEVLHGILSGQLDMPIPPSGPQPSAPVPVASLAEPKLPGTSPHDPPSSLPARLAKSGRRPPSTRNSSFPSGRPAAGDSAAFKLVHPLQRLSKRFPLQHLSPCRSAPTNVLQMFNNPSPGRGRPGVGVSHSAPSTIPAAWRHRPHARGGGALPGALAQLPQRTAEAAASMSTSGNTSATTWPSLDRESVGTASWGPSTLSTVTADFHEVLTMYLGLVRELKRAGLGVSQEAGGSVPAIFVTDTAALRAFADGAAPSGAVGAVMPEGIPGSPAIAASAQAGPSTRSAGGAEAAEEAEPAASGAQGPSNDAVAGAAAEAAAGVDEAAAGVDAPAELASGLASMFKHVRLLDFTARKLETYVAAAAVSQGGDGRSDQG